MELSTLSTPIEYLKGVGPEKANVLHKELDVFTFHDLLDQFPFRYVDRSKIYSINELDPNMPYVQIKAVITSYKVIGRHRAKRLVAHAKDETGSVELIWFKGVTWIQRILQKGKPYMIFGKPTVYNRKINIAHPELELEEDFEKSAVSALMPVYHTSEKMKHKWLNTKGILKLMSTLFQNLKEADINENLSGALMKKYKLTGRYQAYRQIHFPEDNDHLLAAQRRIKFEELFFIQLRLLKLKLIRKQKFEGFVFKDLGVLFNDFYDKNLPFELTKAQKRVIKEIRQDVLSGEQMNRMLQGDVGSGKTIVALIAILMALDNGYQGCIMAPTEILARQHFESISKLVEGLDIEVRLLTGSTIAAHRNTMLERLVNGDIHIMIGTHAIIEDRVEFHNLGLVVIDEQHRFGVAQRAKLWKKNDRPQHMLVMTATPIPRTLAMTLYGDLDVSILDELPPGRKPAITVNYSDAQRLKLFGFMKEQIKSGGQVFIVYPLIEESATLDLKDLMDGYESITRAFAQPEYQVSIVHGKMNAEDKQFEMQRFIKKQTQIMVATTVIEVGVDIPNASVMVIENAERFGLSQLHQLRGRIGRGNEQSYCVLMTGDKIGNDARKRIRTMLQTTDGFKIAEADLQMRGPGDLAGTQQSGLLLLKLANLATDGRILTEARHSAIELLEDDPMIEMPENQPVNDFLKKMNAEKPSYSKIA